MGITQLPLLDESFEPFDWADWPDSRKALIAGVQTVAFERAAWNAIIDKMSEILEVMPEGWDTTYTSKDAAIMTATSNALTAARFNSVALNIKKHMPFPWAWHVDPDFWGYIGRETVRGYADFGSMADVVYSTYLEELVRRLNLLINVLKNSAIVLSADAIQSSQTNISSYLQKAKVAAVLLKHISRVTSSTGVIELPSVPIATSTTSVSTEKFDVIALPSSPVVLAPVKPNASSLLEVLRIPSFPIIQFEQSKTSQLVTVLARSATHSEAQHAALVRTFAEVMAGILVETTARSICSSSSLAIAGAGLAVGTSTQWCSLSKARGRVSTALPLASEAVKALQTNVLAYLLQGPSAELRGKACSKVLPNVDLIQRPRLPLSTHELSYSKNSVKVLAQRVRESDAEHVANVKVSANSNTLPSQAIVGLSAPTVATCAIAAQVPPRPVQVVSTGAIAACVTTTVTQAEQIDSAQTSRTLASVSGTLDGSVGLRSRALSNAMCVCSLDSAWMPPVWVGNGLWIRQVHDEPVQREDNSLEVT